MNPDTNRFEKLSAEDFASKEQDKIFAERLAKLSASAQTAGLAERATLVRPDGSPVPEHWSIFQVGKAYEINGYTFRCAYIGETSILFEPAGPVVVGEARRP